MGMFSKLFSRKQEDVSEKKEAVNNPLLASLDQAEQKEAQLLSADRYLSVSDYHPLQKDNENVLKDLQVIEFSGTLDAFCMRNGVAEEDTVKKMEDLKNISELVDQHNEEFIQKKMLEEKDYLDQVLKTVDPQIVLDEDQRRVVLTDEDHMLVVAGAGAGKTTTIAAKVKYLVDVEHVDPSQILVISFTNKAVKELRERINDQLQIPCPIATFHSTGNAVLHKNNPERLNIVEPSRLYFVITDYLKKNILNDEQEVRKLIDFFASYIDVPEEAGDPVTFLPKLSKAYYTTMKGELEGKGEEIIDQRTKRRVTIQNEILRSGQEVQIANFLYLHDIDYEYEPLYPYDITGSRKPYTPDFLLKQGNHTCYLEHFGISEDGRNPRYDDVQLSFYKKAINDKILLHRKHHTSLIYTFSSYKDERSLLEHLEEQLVKAGFEVHERPYQEVMQKLVDTEENRYIRKMTLLLQRFINNFKTNGYTNKDFDMLRRRTKNVRTLLFLDLCQDCYLQYETWLREHHAVDFEDMINNSAKVLREVKEMKQKLDFRWIIVDEYQDISRQRFDLTTALSQVTDAKIMAVGDDWQSIYAFSGSDISLFTDFAKKMGDAKTLKIVKTYRNSQEVIDIAGNFIQQNPSQIRKKLISPKHIEHPVIIFTYDGKRKAANGTNRTGANDAMAAAVEKCIAQILKLAGDEGKKDPGSILLIGRFGFDGDHLARTGRFEYDRQKSMLRSVRFPNAHLTFMTAHSSKGLGFDNVIIINGKNETYGFPSKIDDDPVLKLVVKEDHSYAYAEERRLFYVAMTRTKNRVYFVAPEDNPSEFLLELKKEYPDVTLAGKWNTNPVVSGTQKRCPICGFPLQYRYKKAYGLRLFICTNEPEACGFMTNEYSGGKLSIMKCDSCRTGYLIVKHTKNDEYMLGCTNYKKDGTGCNRAISRNEYYMMMGYPLVENTAPVSVQSASSEPLYEEGKKSEEIKDRDLLRKQETVPVLYKGKDLNEVVFTILGCLNETKDHYYYGETTWIAMLRGKEGRNRNFGKLKKLPQYGIYSGYSNEDLHVIFSWLEQHHFITKTKGWYPVILLSADAFSEEKTITRRQLMTLKKQLEVQ
ncbi:MAG: UvrD-helicase domain-containing protein [Bulleidia sp.]|nr:UvrD-helicase domain-containing protein [Bulleidia sp.]